MRILWILLVLGFSQTVFAQLTYQDIKDAIAEGQNAQAVEEMLYEQGIAFEINRDLLIQMSKEGQPDWLIDLLMAYDQPVYTYQEEQPHSGHHYHDHLYYHRPYAGFGFWPSYYWHRYDHRFYDRYYWGFPYAGYALYGAYLWYDPFYGYPIRYNHRYQSHLYRNARLTPRGVVVESSSGSRQAVRRDSQGNTNSRRQVSTTRNSRPIASRRSGTSTRSRTPVATPTTSRASGTSTSTASRRGSSSTPSRTRVSAPTSSRSSSNDSKAVRRRN